VPEKIGKSLLKSKEIPLPTVSPQLKPLEMTDAQYQEYLKAYKKYLKHHVLSVPSDKSEVKPLGEPKEEDVIKIRPLHKLLAVFDKDQSEESKERGE